MMGELLPEEWRWVTLGEVADPESKAIVSGPFGSNIGRRFFVDYGVPVIRGNNLTTDMTRFIDEGFVFVTEEKANELGNCEALPDDLVFTAAGSLGQVGIIPRDASFPRYIISNKQLRARLDKCRVDPLFAFYWFSSSRMVAYIQQRNTGSSVPLINLGILRSLPMPLPPLPEQRAIAHILGTLDDKIELNRRMNQTLEAIARALFKSWFVDFDPVRAKVAGQQPSGLAPHIADLFPDAFVESELGEIPKGWHARAISDFCNIAIGGDWGSDQPFDEAVEAVCLRGVDLEYLRRFGWADAPRRWIKRASISKRHLNEQDILIAASGAGPLGRPLWIAQPMKAVFDIPVVYSNFCKRLHCKSVATAAYIDRWLHMMRESGEIWEYATGTSIPNLDTNSLLSKFIIFPPEPILEYYLDFIRPIVDRLYSQESRTLAALCDTLLPRLISGELRVPDAEQLIRREL